MSQNLKIQILSDEIIKKNRNNYFYIRFRTLHIFWDQKPNFEGGGYHNKKMFQVLFFIEKKNQNCLKRMHNFFFKSDEKICRVYRDSQIDHISKTKNRKINFSFVSKHNAS